MDIRLSALTELDKYPAKQHAQRVTTALGASEGLIYLRGAPTEFYDDSDMSPAFRQRRYFYYLSGCDEPNCHVTYDIARQQLTLWLAPFTPYEVMRRGRGSTVEEASLKYDIDTAVYSDDLVEYLKSWSSKHATMPIHVLHNSTTHFPPSEFNYDHFNSDKLLDAMDACRIIKDSHEIKLIKRANAISAEAHTNVLRAIRHFTNEAQAAATIYSSCIAGGAPVQAYTPIVASGPNGAVLHYGENNQPFADRLSMVLDAGAEYQLYSSDVTRSFPLSGHWTTEGQAIYDLVADMQSSAMAYLGPGEHMARADALCHVKCVQGLIGLGILKGDSEREVFESGISSAFFTHGLGHYVGLEVHDVPARRPSSASNPSSSLLIQARDCSPCASSSPALEPGMVVTVEPGIYFNRYLLETFYRPQKRYSKFIDWEILEKYYPIGGIRIEDDILVTETGWENLTTTPKGEDALRIIRGEC
ncbi:hypothetical protein ANO11243_088660 [Dothideomycetidae sp. 11243]|nr:hypothetical protein ANO11243_088660 [fungal sp. No.11243]